MKRLKALGLCLLVACACCTATAAPSQAKEEPFFEINHVRLGPTQTTELFFTNAIISYTFKLPGGIVVKCTSSKLVPGALLIGSETGQPGTGKETVEFSSCTQTGNGLLCTVESEKFKTSPLVSTQVTDTAKKLLYVYFKPETGEKFATIKFSSSLTCTQTSVEITGSTACEYFIEGKVVEAGKEPAESVRPEFNFPAIQIGEVWSKATTIKTGLKVGSEAATLEGRSETNVFKEEPWGVYT